MHLNSGLPPTAAQIVIQVRILHMDMMWTGSWGCVLCSTVNQREVLLNCQVSMILIFTLHNAHLTMLWPRARQVNVRSEFLSFPLSTPIGQTYLYLVTPGGLGPLASKCIGFRAIRTGYESMIHYIKPLQLWASCLFSLWFSFLICKIRIILI